MVDQPKNLPFSLTVEQFGRVFKLVIDSKPYRSIKRRMLPPPPTALSSEVLVQPFEHRT